MLPAEREDFATRAADMVLAVFQHQPGDFYRDALKHKFLLLLQAVDHLAAAGDHTVPILFEDVIPGFDLVVMRGANHHVESAISAAGMDARAISAVSDTGLSLLAHALDWTVGRSALEGAHVFESGDGGHYFAFLSAHRSAVLAELGIMEEAVTRVDLGMPS